MTKFQLKNILKIKLHYFQCRLYLGFVKVSAAQSVEWWKLSSETIHIVNEHSVKQDRTSS